jgi:hypothetical protein
VFADVSNYPRPSARSDAPSARAGGSLSPSSSRSHSPVLSLCSVVSCCGLTRPSCRCVLSCRVASCGVVLCCLVFCCVVCVVLLSVLPSIRLRMSICRVFMP